MQGVIRDASGASVPGAQVKLTAATYLAQTTTDNSGNFAFDGVSAISGMIVVTAKGFQRAEQSWTERFFHWLARCFRPASPPVAKGG